MNKNGKAAIAVGAGIVLLLGGGGTLALWNANGAVSGGTVSAGTLDVTGGGAGSWYVAKYVDDDNDPGTPDVLDTNPADYTAAVTPGLIVPGDDYIFIAPAVTLTASGGKLDYVITGTADSVTVKDASGADVDPSDFAGLGLTAAAGATSDHSGFAPLGTDLGLKQATDITASGTMTIPAAGTHVYEVTSSTSGTTAAFQTYLHVALSAAGTTGTEAQGYSFALGNDAIAIQQVILAH